MKLFDIRVIMSRRKKPCNNTALVGHAKAFSDAKPFDPAGILHNLTLMFHRIESS